ncbi:MAG: hypothetical protein WBB40_02295 [Psychrobacter alimentarius]
MIMESIAVSVCANWVYEFLKLALPLSPSNVVAYFANNQITLTELQAEQLTNVMEHDNLELKAEQLSEKDFIKELENNEQFQQFVESINQTVINNNTDNRIQINGDNSSISTDEGDFLKDSSRKIEAKGNYTEDNSVTNNYTATNNEKKH